MTPLKSLLIIAATFIMLSGLFAADNKYSIRVKEVVDGDTIKADIKLPFSIIIENQVVRLLDYDAWECKHRTGKVITPEEIVKGLAAKAALNALINSAERIYIELDIKREHDDFGRVLARLFLVDKSGMLIEVSKYMKDNGHDRNISK